MVHHSIVVLNFLLTCRIIFVQAHTESQTEYQSASATVKKNHFENLLANIHDLTNNVSGDKCDGSEKQYEMIPISLEPQLFPALTSKVDLISQILGDDLIGKSTNDLEKEGIVKSVLCRTISSSSRAKAIRISYSGGGSIKVLFLEKSNSTPREQECRPQLNTSKVQNEPWYRPLHENDWNTTRYQPALTTPDFKDLSNPKRHGLEKDTRGRWTFPYSDCSGRWMITYTKMVYIPDQSRNALSTSSLQSKCAISVDVDISYMDIDQCELSNQPKEGVIQNFRNTHKCDPNSTYCQFEHGLGWRRGGYSCKCKEGFYPKMNVTNNGSIIEVAWKSKKTYDLYSCLPCAKDCESCFLDTRCQAHYNMAFRIVLLTISMLCIVLTFIVMAIVYRNRSIKVFKVASPAFLEICLFGCIIMYSEMATIFPVLDVYWCIATKWARHMGFCITFSSLLMKTWRVSLTYRVKSAHKIKLTDKQLLQWMTPILLIMSIYLGAWTISDPPQGENIYDQDDRIFKQCTYNWWDHALAIGEMSFLLWGVKVCFSVRKAESFFDEAKCISWAVYNITIVNIIMACFHIFIFPMAGPDLKYFFGFIRTQLSTTTTIGLVFGPKLVRVLKGTGDQLDNRARAKGVTASFSINGIGGSGDEAPDPAEENEELKEEIQKLAAQIEFMKIVHMEMNNRHLRPKPGGYFSTDKNSILSTSGQSPTIHKNSICRMEISENSSSAALNPTSEVTAEKV